MPTRNVVLTDRQARFIERLVSSGTYQNASEVLREGLRLVERRESENEARLDALRRAAELGIADFDSGRFRRFESREEIASYVSELNELAVAGDPNPTVG